MSFESSRILHWLRHDWKTSLAMGCQNPSSPSSGLDLGQGRERSVFTLSCPIFSTSLSLPRVFVASPVIALRVLQDAKSGAKRFILIHIYSSPPASPEVATNPQTSWRRNFPPFLSTFGIEKINGAQGPPLEKEMATHSVLLPGKFHGRRSLVGYSPRGHKESNTTERLHFKVLQLMHGKTGNGAKVFWP